MKTASSTGFFFCLLLSTSKDFTIFAISTLLSFIKFYQFLFLSSNLCFF